MYLNSWSMFLTTRFYILTAVAALTVGAGYAFSPLYTVGWILVGMIAVAFVADCFMLWTVDALMAVRHCPERLSNGDDNELKIDVESIYRFPIYLHIIDELPVVFQRRDMDFRVKLAARSSGSVTYTLRPTKRGLFYFGHLLLFAATPIGLMRRRYVFEEEWNVAVYPSFQRLHRYELAAMNHRLTEVGIKRVRHTGNNTEFEQIRDYVPGDDYRTINWKASARRRHLMTNVYQEERSQQIISIIDKGRMMQQSFAGMTLLDYAINSALVLSYIAMRKSDRAGIATFGARFGTFVPPKSELRHVETILETLYKEQTTFGESDMSVLTDHLDRYLSKRSLLILYTNISGQDALERQMPFLRQLNSRHRLLVIIFEDSELRSYVEQRPVSMEDYFSHVIAEKTIHDQRSLLTYLRQNGIAGLLTSPESLSADVINKYLELKTKVF